MTDSTLIPKHATCFKTIMHLRLISKIFLAILTPLYPIYLLMRYVNLVTISVFSGKIITDPNNDSSKIEHYWIVTFFFKCCQYYHKLSFLFIYFAKKFKCLLIPSLRHYLHARFSSLNFLSLQ